jgi:hypothetical protein
LVRARPLDASAGDSGDVQLHAFGTSDNRRRLHYLLPYRVPARLEDCGIQSTIYFTDYALGNLFPTARAARKVAIRDTASYEFDQLDQFAVAQGWGTTAWERIDLVLDAIIDQRVEFDEAP